MKYIPLFLLLLLATITLQCQRQNPSQKFVSTGEYPHPVVTILDPGKFGYVISHAKEQIESNKSQYIDLVRKVTGLKVNTLLFYTTSIDSLNSRVVLRYFSPTANENPEFAGAQTQFVFNYDGKLIRIYIKKLPYE